VSPGSTSLIEAPDVSNGDSWGTVTDDAYDGRGLSSAFSSFVKALGAGGRPNCELWAEFDNGIYDD